MILEWYLGMDVPDPDSVVMGKFKDLRAGKGGLKLVHMVLSHAIWENCHILLACNRHSVGLVYCSGDRAEDGF